MGIPSHFKTLDTEITKKLVEGQEDLLTPAANARDKLYRDVVCPSCGVNSFKIIPKKMNPNELVPYHYLECRNCGCSFDPKTGLIHKDGIKKVKSDLIP